MGKLQFGDFSFIGNGPDDIPVSIGIERKTVSDMLNCMNSGRFAGFQLPGMLTNYNRIYLFIEGPWRQCSQTGVLEVPNGPRGWAPYSIGGRTYMAKQIDKFVCSMEEFAGLRVRMSHNPQDTAMKVTSIYNWWQEEYESHASHVAMHKKGVGDNKVIVPPNLVARMAAELPGVGPKRARAVARVFRSPMEMILADKAEWEKVEGIGRKTAEQIISAVMEGGK